MKIRTEISRLSPFNFEGSIDKLEDTIKDIRERAEGFTNAGLVFVQHEDGDNSFYNLYGYRDETLSEEKFRTNLAEKREAETLVRDKASYEKLKKQFEGK